MFNQLNDRYDLHFADASSDMDVISDVVPFDRKHKIPLAEAKEFVEEVRDLVIRLKINVIVPGVDEELIKIKEMGQVDKDIDILCPRPEFIAKMLNKDQMAKVFEEKEFLRQKFIN